jgi:hypothetical protein
MARVYRLLPARFHTIASSDRSTPRRALWGGSESSCLTSSFAAGRRREAYRELITVSHRAELHRCEPGLMNPSRWIDLYSGGVKLCELLRLGTIKASVFQTFLAAAM